MRAAKTNPPAGFEPAGGSRNLRSVVAVTPPDGGGITPMRRRPAQENDAKSLLQGFFDEDGGESVLIETQVEFMFRRE